MLPVAKLQSSESQIAGRLPSPLAGLLKFYDDVANYVASVNVFDLVAFLTVYTLIGNSHTTVDMGFAVIVAALACFSKIRNHCGFWFGVVAVSLPRMAINFHGYEDHCFYLIYWCAALGLALSGENREFVLRKSGRLLIGICFALGCVWKLVSAEFTGGSVFHFTLLFDRRMAEMITSPIGGASVASLTENLAAYQALRAADQPGNAITLDFPGRVSFLAWLMTAWTIAIEGLIAALFLLPSSRFTDRFRDLSLIFFMLTTYMVVPVLGFACAFVALGVAQTQSPRIRLAYLLTSLTLFGWFSMRSEIIALIT